MADAKITDLTAITGANTATGDLFVVVDVSDTTMAASGTNKKITLQQVYLGLHRRRPSISTLTSASNLIAVDLSLNDNFKITLGENNTLSAPTNAVEGMSGVITFIQDGTGGRTMAYDSFWDFAGSTPALSTAAGAIDHLSYYVEPGASRARVQLSKEAG
jgi:hypothetical protein